MLTKHEVRIFGLAVLRTIPAAKIGKDQTGSFLPIASPYKSAKRSRIIFFAKPTARPI
jgi:hypothetical protein